MVDDSPTDIFIAQRCFMKTGYENPFISYPGGEEFLDYMRKVQDGTEAVPALVLLDINMPKMSGFEVLEVVRREKEFSNIPVIMIFTNSSSAGDKKKSEDLGANGFQTKPHEMCHYLEFFNKVFGARV